MKMANSEITPNTRVNLGAAIAAVVAFAGGAVWLNNSLSEVRRNIDVMAVELRADIRAVASRLESGMEDRWKKADMIRWADQLRRGNPAMAIPEVEAR